MELLSSIASRVSHSCSAFVLRMLAASQARAS
jgi:hypothetical protein